MKLAVVRGHFVVTDRQHLGPKNVAVVEKWLRNRDFSSIILNSDAVGTYVNGCYSEGGRLSEVAITRGSTEDMQSTHHLMQPTNLLSVFYW